MKSENIRLPAVKKVYIEVIPPFDADLIRACLKKQYKASDYETLNWPEAVKVMYRHCEEAENKLLHIESCCRKALDENIIPLKNQLWNLILKYSQK